MSEEKNGVKVVKKKLNPVYIQVIINILITFVIGYLGAYTYIKTWENNQPLIVTAQSDESDSDIVDVVYKVQDSVVSIAIGSLSVGGGENPVNNIGTGFVVDRSGIIITNQHVVSDLDGKYLVVDNNGEEYRVLSIERDNVNDIALLKVETNEKELKALELGDSEELVVGQTVIAIGTPLGDYVGSVTSGIISGLNRSVSTQSGGFWDTVKEYDNVIQTDAAVNPGNSGGPLLDENGIVIGVNFATTSNADNISFALPINVIKDRLDEYRKFGKFLKPYLGVEYQIISPVAAQYYDDVVAGAYIVRVVPDSPADKVELKRGDVIVEIQGEVVESSFAGLVQGYKVGNELNIKVWRDGEVLDMVVVLEEVS